MLWGNFEKWSYIFTLSSIVIEPSNIQTLDQDTAKNAKFDKSQGGLHYVQVGG